MNVGPPLPDWEHLNCWTSKRPGTQREAERQRKPTATACGPQPGYCTREPGADLHAPGHRPGPAAGADRIRVHPPPGDT
jgi:hypothetical protein